MKARVMPIPVGLTAAGSERGEFVPVARVGELGPGEMLRVTRGDLDVLIVNTPAGLCAVDDRCPHMAAPLSLGSLDDSVVACPLHSGCFDLATGDVVQFPTTGGLDAAGGYHPPWTPANAAPKPGPPPTDLKARARAATRVRRLRYYPLKISGDAIEVAFPD